MLSERSRRRLLVDLLAIAEKCMTALEASDQAAAAAAVSEASLVRAAMTDSYLCEMRTCFDEMADAIAATPIDARRLRVAALKARGHALAASSRTRIESLGGGVSRVTSGDPVRVTYEVKVRPLVERFGASLVANFLRVMAGASRLAALLTYLKLNSEHVPDNSAVRERNFHLAALLSLAYLKEIAEALGPLAGSKTPDGKKIREILTSGASDWAELQRICERWRQEKPIRDDIMFHLGHPEETTKKLTEYSESDLSLPFIQLDAESAFVTAYHPGAETLLLGASEMTIAEFDDVVRDGIPEYSVVCSAVIRVLDDLLRQCGARMPPLESQSMKIISS